MGFADVVKSAFDATNTGQAIQRGKANEQALQDKKEQDERDFADYVQTRGARPVLNGMVHRDYVSGNGSVIPNAIFDKAGNDGRQVISHKDPITGEKIQWELGTPDEQLAHQAALKLSQQMLEAPMRQQAAQEATTNAANTTRATTAAQLGAQLQGQQAENQVYGAPLPEDQANVLGLSDDQKARLRSGAQLSQLSTAANQIQTTRANVAENQQRLLQQKQQLALQQLSGVSDQAGLDDIRQQNPEGTSGWPATFNPTWKNQRLQTALTVPQQIEQGILHLNNDVAPADWDKSVDDLKLDPSLASQTKVQIHSVLGSAGNQKDKLEKIQKIVGDAVSESQKPATALATERLTQPLKTQAEIAARVGTAQAMNASGPELASVAPADRNAVQNMHQKSVMDLNAQAADASRIHTLIQAAQGGNKAAPALVPIAELRGFLNRINGTELKSVSSQAGSLSDQVEGWIKGKTEGQPVPPEILKATDELAGLQMSNAEQKHAGEIKAINIAHKSNLTPTKVEDLGYSRPPSPAGDVPKLPASLQQSDIGKIFVSPKTGQKMKITAVNPQNPTQFQSQPVQ